MELIKSLTDKLKILEEEVEAVKEERSSMESMAASVLKVMLFENI